MAASQPRAFIAGGVRDIYALVSFSLCAFVVLTIAMEFTKGARAISAKSDLNFARALVELSRRNTRRYGGYIVHLGVVLIFVGLTGAIFNRQQKAIRTGDRLQLGAFALRVREISSGENENYLWQRASIDVFDGTTPIGTLSPQREYYKAARPGGGPRRYPARAQ